MMVGAFATVLFALVSVGHACDPGYDTDCREPMALTASLLKPVASRDSPTTDGVEEKSAGPKSGEASVAASPSDGSQKKPVSSNSKETSSSDASQKTPTGSNSNESLPSDASQKEPTDPKSEEDSTPDASQKEKCEVHIPKDCTFPFSYKGQEYHTCIDVDAIATKWCSVDKHYSGDFRQCKSTCQKGKWSVKSIVGTAVAGGVAAAGIGLTAAVVVLKHQEEGRAAAGAMPGVEVRSLQKPATSPGATAAAAMAGVQVGSTPVSLPVAAARFLDKPAPNVAPVSVPVPLAAPQAVPAAPTQGNGWQVGLAILAVFVVAILAVVGIVASGLTKKHKRRTQNNFMEIEDEAQPGYPESYAYGEYE